MYIILHFSIFFQEFKECCMRPLVNRDPLSIYLLKSIENSKAKVSVIFPDLVERQPFLEAHS